MVSLEYLAGFFDGEGCVHVREYRQEGHRYHSMSVSVSQNDPRPLNELAARFGGNVIRAHAKSYVWQRRGQGAARVLVALQPYLIVKAEQARLALLLQQSFRGQKRGARPITPWERAEREAIVEAAREVGRPTFDAYGRVA